MLCLCHSLNNPGGFEIGLSVPIDEPDGNLRRQEVRGMTENRTDAARVNNCKRPIAWTPCSGVGLQVIGLSMAASTLVEGV